MADGNSETTAINNGEKRSRGTVKWFNGWKGFGFITPDVENSEDLFVHQTSINFEGFRTLYDGQRVEFDVAIGDDGRTRAANVDALRNGSGSRGGGGGRSVECYSCGRLGHLARDCYYNQGGGVGGGDVRGGRGGGGRGRGRGRRFVEGGEGDGGYGRGRGGGRGGGFYGGRRGGGGGGGRGGRGGGRGECYNCGEEGHFARDCPNNAQT